MSNNVKSGPFLSPQDLRRLSLLKSTVELLSEVVKDKFRYCERSNPDRGFWRALQRPIYNSATAKWPSPSFSGRTQLVDALLLSFESMVNFDNHSYKRFNASVFPCLEMLRLEEAGSRNVISYELLIPPDKRSDFIRYMKQLERILSGAEDEISPEPLIEDFPVMRKSIRQRSIWPKVKRLLTVISNHWRCSCQPNEAALMLLTHQKILKDQDPVTFPMLFKHTTEWQESSITIKEEVKHILSSETSLRVYNLCDAISDARPSRLYLDIKDTNLYRRSPRIPQTKELCDRRIISLSEAILRNSIELRSIDKVCLAIVLSWSLLDFCDEPWFRGGWTKDTIHLMQYEDGVSLRPLLVTKMHTQQNPRQLDTQRKMSDEIMLLYHSILLMEIFRQAPLPTLTLDDFVTDTGSNRRLIRRHFRKIKWDVHEKYQLSVQACIDVSETIPLCSRSESRVELIQTFYDKVITPLQNQFEADWHQMDPDEAIASIQFQVLQRDIQPEELELEPRVRTVISSALYDTNDEPSQQEINAAKKWFEEFDMCKKELPKCNEIKIAILDTGIDMFIPDISKERGRIQCRHGESLCHDNDGHGTHVADLLLRVAPHARLLITKVTDSNELMDGDIEKIAEAIIYYSSDGDDKADIINLSFGFYIQEGRFAPIREAIENACKNKVLIFAAAGNSGGNEPVSWPASMTNKVLSVASSDGMGNMSNFSTRGGLGRKIRALGAGLQSCHYQPGSTTEYIYRNGTSFATPVAVAIASIVLAFGDEVLYGPRSKQDAENTFERHENAFALPGGAAELLRRLRTRAGIEEILCRMCVRPGEPDMTGYHDIQPWHFLRIGKQERVHVMLNHLRNVPE